MNSLKIFIISIFFICLAGFVLTAAKAKAATPRGAAITCQSEEGDHVYAFGIFKGWIPGCVSSAGYLEKLENGRAASSVQCHKYNVETDGIAGTILDMTGMIPRWTCLPGTRGLSVSVQQDASTGHFTAYVIQNGELDSILNCQSH